MGVIVQCPGLRITPAQLSEVGAVATLVAAAWVAAGIARGKLIWSAVSAAVFYVVINVLARGVIPGAYQKLVVSANELSREAPYLRNHIDATRKSWGLDRVESRDLSGEKQLTMSLTCG